MGGKKQVLNSSVPELELGDLQGMQDTKHLFLPSDSLFQHSK